MHPYFFLDIQDITDRWQQRRAHMLSTFYSQYLPSLYCRAAAGKFIHQSLYVAASSTRVTQSVLLWQYLRRPEVHACCQLCARAAAAAQQVSLGQT